MPLEGNWSRHKRVLNRSPDPQGTCHVAYRTVRSLTSSVPSDRRGRRGHRGCRHRGHRCGNPWPGPWLSRTNSGS